MSNATEHNSEATCELSEAELASVSGGELQSTVLKKLDDVRKAVVDKLG